MVEKNFRTEFENNWERYSKILRETSQEVIEAFKGTSIEDNLNRWYRLAVPQKKESPINFLLRNARYSFATTSSHHAIELAVNDLMAKIGWYTGKIPLLKKIMRLDALSTELYLGQETRGYVSDKKMTKGAGFGNDHLGTVISNFARPMDLDIDVGFTSPNISNRRRNWFYQINVFDESLILAAENAHQIIRDARYK